MIQNSVPRPHLGTRSPWPTPRTRPVYAQSAWTMFQWKAKFPPITHSMIQTSSPWSRRWSPVWRCRLFLSDWFFCDIVRKGKFVEKCRPFWEIEGLDLDCKTVRILAYSRTPEQSNKRSGTRLKTERRVRLARFVRVRLLRHALPISLLILRKKNDCFASKTTLLGDYFKSKWRCDRRSFNRNLGNCK